MARIYDQKAWSINPKIDFKLIGENRKTDFEKFKEAFFIFQKEKNKH